MTGPAPTSNGNPAPRVGTCVECEARFPAGPSGPLPHRCQSCRRPRALVHRIGSARNAARAAHAPDPIRSLLDGAYAAAREWVTTAAAKGAPR